MLTDKMIISFFESPLFQSSYKKYLEKFGYDIDKLFEGDIRSKIRFSNSVLAKMYEGKLDDAYHEIIHFEKLCTTDEERKIYERLLGICKNKEEIGKIEIGDWVFDRGYYKVIDKTEESFLIKKAFSKDFTFSKYDPKSLYRFKYEISDLSAVLVPSKSELEKIDKCFSDNPTYSELFTKHTDRMLDLRERLLNGGMTEAKADFSKMHFYKKTADKLAFIINLTDNGDQILIGYGFAAISDQAYEDFLIDHGRDDDDINLRFCQIIKSDEDTVKAFSEIRKFYDEHSSCSKDEILAIRQDRRKRFIEMVKETLKPMGFKKKNTTWTKALDDNLTLTVILDKSQFSDIFSFPIWITKNLVESTRACFSDSLFDYSINKLNWQFCTDDEIDAIMTELKTKLEVIISTPLTVLMKESNCIFHCERIGKDRCDGCTVN